MIESPAGNMPGRAVSREHTETPRLMMILPQNIAPGKMLILAGGFLLELRRSPRLGLPRQQPRYSRRAPRI